MDDKYCNCHLKHAAILDQLREDSRANKEDHEAMWESIKQKVGQIWMFALIPAFLAWIGFQAAIYESVKNVETKVAVMQAELRTKQ